MKRKRVKPGYTGSSLWVRFFIDKHSFNAGGHAQFLSTNRVFKLCPHTPGPKKKKKNYILSTKAVSFPGKQKLISFVDPFTLSQDEMKQLAKSERLAIRISNLANVVLFAAKVFASIESRSLAVIASTLDSLLDLLSGFILWFTSHAMRNPNQYHYPIGKKRMQPVVSHLIQQLWGCIWKYLNVYLNFRLKLPAIILISFSSIIKNSLLFLSGHYCNSNWVKQKRLLF